jgi:trans-2,3-dihydro-3-hydroxyanthranilate isomerase
MSQPGSTNRRFKYVDVFTDTPRHGNPLLVFIDGYGLSEDVMQALAQLSGSETVFVMPGDSEAHRSIRIFTPTTELAFGGHSVLGTAVVLGQTIADNVIRLRTAAGVVPVTLSRGRLDATFAEMDAPIPSVVPCPSEGLLLHELGVQRSELPVTAYRSGPDHVYVQLTSAGAVARLRPSLVNLSRMPLAVSAFSLEGSRVKTRVFAPGLGLREDVASGSAAGPLALHLARHGRIEFGQLIAITQGNELGRPSRLYVSVEGTAQNVDRVVVSGCAVVVGGGHCPVA